MAQLSASAKEAASSDSTSCWVIVSALPTTSPKKLPTWSRRRGTYVSSASTRNVSGGFLAMTSMWARAIGACAVAPATCAPALETDGGRAGRPPSSTRTAFLGMEAA